MGCQHSKCQVRKEERGSGSVRDRKGNFWNWIGRKRRAMVQILKSSDDDDVSATTYKELVTLDKLGRAKAKTSFARRADGRHVAGNQSQEAVERGERLQQAAAYGPGKKSRCPTPASSEIADKSTIEQSDRSPTQRYMGKPSLTSAESSCDDFIPIIPSWRMRNRPVEEKECDVTSEEEEEQEAKGEEEEEEEEEENTVANQEQGKDLACHSEEPVISRRGNDITSQEKPVRDWIGGDGSWQAGRQDQMEEEQEPANASMSRRAGPGRGSLAREQSERQEELSNSKAIEKRMSRRESIKLGRRGTEQKNREKKNFALRESLKEQVVKIEEEIRVQKDSELKELLKDEKFAEAYGQKKQREEEQKRREEYLRENGFVSEEIDDEDLRQYKYRAIQRQIAEKEERRKIQKQRRAEEEKRLEEEKKRKEEMKLERYFERLRLKRENEKQQLKQQREEEERREKAQGILDEIETIAEMRKRETRARQEKMKSERLSDERRQRLSVIDEIDESYRESENSSNRSRSELPSDSIDDLLQRKTRGSPSRRERFLGEDTKLVNLSTRALALVISATDTKVGFMHLASLLPLPNLFSL
ncbi:uncharacterized protein [Apostichopus japonicus]|uniref:uncharacterized protein isoform X3 n=1 Tax=Stichopus japonicus TaxID=307972 RepID=UPI003AB7FEAA